MSEFEKVEILAKQIVAALHPRNQRMLLSLQHNVSRRELVRELAFERLQFLERDNHKPRTLYYAVEPFSQQPVMDNFEYERFDPEPTHQIWVSEQQPVKTDVNRSYYFACSPAKDEFRICGYVHWNPADEIVEDPPETIDMKELYAAMRPLVTEGISQLANSNVGCLRFDFTRRGDVNIYSYEGQLHDGVWKDQPAEMYLRRASKFDCAHDALLDGTNRLISLDGEVVDLAQDEFEATYPYWIGAVRFDEQIRNCARKVLADSLATLIQQDLISGQREWNVLLQSYDDEESAPLKQTVVGDGFVIYELDSPPEMTPVRDPLPHRLRMVQSRYSDDLSNYNGVQKKFSELTRRGVPEQDAIQQFADVMAPFVHKSAATGGDVIEACANFYRDVRIDGVVDSLMLEWGTSRPHLLDGFTDLRESGSPRWDNEEYQWIGFTRQARTGKGDDDLALCLFLYFEKATGDDASGMIEFEGVDALDDNLKQFSSTPYVSQLLTTTPSRIAAFTSCVG